MRGRAPSGNGRRCVAAGRRRFSRRGGWRARSAGWAKLAPGEPVGRAKHAPAKAGAKRARHQHASERIRRGHALRAWPALRSRDSHMSYADPIWLEGRRKYWTRPDGYRFFKPGCPEAKMPGWLDPWATRVRMQEAAEDEARVQAEAAQEDRSEERR